MLTTKEVAKIFGVDGKTVRRWAEQWHDSGGEEGLLSIKLGEKLWRFPREGVVTFQEKQPSRRNAA